MMLILRDDPVIETFDSPSNPPNWIETIDVKNCEYQFCDHLGQKYIGRIKKGKGFFSSETFELIPDGTPNVENLHVLLEKAEMIESGDRFASLDELKKHLAIAPSRKD